MTHLFERKIWGSKTGSMAPESMLYTTTCNIYSLPTCARGGWGSMRK